ncbi:MAG: VOC family protein [Phycisphaerales bacterium]
MAGNRVVHFEIPANEPEALTRFYGTLFGWSFQKAPFPGPEYWLCDTGTGVGINGAIMKRQHPQHPWMNYVSVEDIDAAITKALELGASLALPKTPVPGVGAFAAVVDPQGNICGLWQESSQK